MLDPEFMTAMRQMLSLTVQLGPNVGSSEKGAAGWREVSGTLIDEAGEAAMSLTVMPL